ncbi:hypothetical protein D3C75_570170 [compost metagenome]
MTKPAIALTELVEKGADADLRKQIFQFVAKRMMEFDVAPASMSKVEIGQTAVMANVIACCKPALAKSI